MELRLLGDVEVWADGRPVDVGPARQRCVLAALFVDTDQVVPVDRLADRVWGERPPQRAREVLHSYVSRLRRVLAAHGGARIERRGGGYVAVPGTATVDLVLFRSEVAAARSAPDDAVALLAYDTALDRWRGEPLGGADSGWLHGVRAALATERLAAELDRTDVALRCGRHAELPGRLEPLVAAHPLDERLAGQFVLALHRCGRSADALAVVGQVRRRLADELGVDPGAELRRLELLVLRGESTHDHGRSVPRQLPADVPAFTGREAELDGLLRLAADTSSIVVVAAIDGMAGIGKTALAVHAAHRLAPRFPDGQLFIDLYGFTEGQTPLDPAAALDVLLRAVGVPGEHVPHTLQERAGLWRSRIAGRRMLVVLDNAAAEAQVTPLLPGAPGCLVLVTSRRRLTSMDHARSVPLDVLTPADAATLFVRVVGRRAAERDAVHDVVELCGRLPLAVRIAAAWWRGRPLWTQAELRDRLVESRHRPAELRAGDRSVAAAFRVSYGHLAAEERLLFLRLGHHPGAEFDVGSATALAGHGDHPRTRGELEELVDVHLLSSPRAGRYRFHDLLRGFATTLAAEEPPDERTAALARLDDHYLRTAAAAMDACHPYDRASRPIVASANAGIAPQEPDAAAAWLDDERATLLALAHRAAEHGSRWPEVLSGVLDRHLLVRARITDAAALHALALDRARTDGDRSAEAGALVRLGEAYYRLGRVDDASTACSGALGLARELGDRRTELRALVLSGSLAATDNRLEEAHAWYETALASARQLADGVREQQALNGIGFVHHWRADFEAAAACHAASLAVATRTGDRHGELAALVRLATVYTWAGHLERAERSHRQALARARELDDPLSESAAVTGLATVSLLGDGDPAVTARLYEQSLVIAREIGDRPGEAYVRRNLADVAYRLGRADEAAAHYGLALDLAHEVGDRGSELHARCGLGRLAADAGDHDAAVEHFEAALAAAAHTVDRDGEVRALCCYGGYLCGTHPGAARRHLERAVEIARGIGSARGEQAARALIAELRGSAPLTAGS